MDILSGEGAVSYNISSRLMDGKSLRRKSGCKVKIFSLCRVDPCKNKTHVNPLIGSMCGL